MSKYRILRDVIYVRPLFLFNYPKVAYNGFKFDGRILLKKIREYKVDKKLADVIVGFIDPLETSKEHFPQQQSRSMNSMMVSLCVQ